MGYYFLKHHFKKGRNSYSVLEAQLLACRTTITHCTAQGQGQQTLLPFSPDVHQETSQVPASEGIHVLKQHEQRMQEPGLAGVK